eukprot:6610495-Alexandrium_andersonii.AAC.1
MPHGRAESHRTERASERLQDLRAADAVGRRLLRIPPHEHALSIAAWPNGLGQGWNICLRSLARG